MRRIRSRRWPRQNNNIISGLESNMNAFDKSYDEVGPQGDDRSLVLDRLHHVIGLTLLSC